MKKYNCHSNFIDKPLNPSIQEVFDGYRKVNIDGKPTVVPTLKTIVTKWMDVECGHMERKSDPLCAGCKRRG
ncbi:MAG: hypothetical protein D6732_20285 [Methanobacteriota archaeon]|nr:MAG: hypothetical protein D6732_20285 [Euryarchaeota archaeon]